MNGKIFFRLLAVLLALAAIAGIAYLAFNAGVSQGLASQVAAGQGSAGNPAYPRYGWPYWWTGFPFYGFGFLGVLFGVFLLVLVFRAISFAFWGPRWGYGRHIRRGWQHGWEDESGVPPMFREWHDRAHKSNEPGTTP